MGTREWGKLKPWMTRWPNSRVSRTYKRGLNKARRRKAKMLILGIRTRSIQGWESECNWKTW